MSQQSSERVLEIENLTITYDAQAVARNVGLVADEGEVHALLGRNGSGKTSLVRCLLGQQEPDGGRIRLFGLDVLRHRADIMARVAVTPEDPNAPSSWSPRELSAFYRPLYPIWHEREYFDRLARWEIDPRKPFGKLSRGQKSLVHLALAFASQPELLILDDPTLGLDAVARRTVIDELISELAERPISVLITSHDFAGIENLATHLSLLHQGRLELQEEAEALKTRCRLLHFQLPDGIDVAPLLAPFEPLALRSLGRAVEALVGRWDERRADVFAAMSLEASRPSLENIFIALTTRAGGLP